MNRHPDGSVVGRGRRGWRVDVYESGVVVRQAIIVRQDWTMGRRCLWDGDGRCYVPRVVGLGVEEVAVGG